MLEDCADCIAFLPEALPFYPGFDHFRLDGQCFSIEPWTAYEQPTCIVEEYPAGAIPAPGPCGVNCIDDCPPDPCICGDTRFDNPQNYDWTNAVVTVSINAAADPRTVDCPGCSRAPGSTVAGGVTPISIAVTYTFPVGLQASSFSASTVDLRPNFDVFATYSASASAIVPTLDECSLSSPSQCQTLSGSGSGVEDVVYNDDQSGRYQCSIVPRIVLVRDTQCRWRLAFAGSGDFNYRGEYCDETSLKYYRSSLSATFTPVFDPSDGGQPIIYGNPFVGVTVPASTVFTQCFDWIANGTVSVGITGVSGTPCLVPSFDCVPVVPPSPGAGGIAPSSIDRNMTGTGGSIGGTGGRPGDLL